SGLRVVAIFFEGELVGLSLTQVVVSTFREDIVKNRNVLLLIDLCQQKNESEARLYSCLSLFDPAELSLFAEDCLVVFVFGHNHLALLQASPFPDSLERAASFGPPWRSSRTCNLSGHHCLPQGDIGFMANHFRHCRADT